MARTLKRLFSFLLVLLLASAICIRPVCAEEVTGPEAFQGMNWELVMLDPLLASAGNVQSVCATEYYIIMIENTADDATQPDTVSAYYRYPYDENGNAVDQYSLAKRVTMEDWEHGNGMTYNPNTHKIYVALYTSTHGDDEGCLYVMNPDTLTYESTVHVVDGYNILGIEYLADRDQYLIQGNADGGYNFAILDNQFNLVEDLGPADLSPGTNSQDMYVIGDYIINSPLTVNLGIGSYVNVYSMSANTLLVSDQVNLDGISYTGFEPESFTEVAPGVLLMAATIIIDDIRYAAFFTTTLSCYFSVNGVAEDASLSLCYTDGTPVEDPTHILRGTSLLLKDASTDENRQLYIDGALTTLSENGLYDALTDIQSDHTISTGVADTTGDSIDLTEENASWNGSPSDTDEDSALSEEKSGGLPAPLIVIFVVAAFAAFWIWNMRRIRIERERKRRRARKRREELRRRMQELDDFED